MISLLHIVVPDKLNLICLQAIVLDNLFETSLSRQVVRIVQVVSLI